MGRFDSLTQLETKPAQQKNTPAAEKTRKPASPQEDKQTNPQDHLTPSPQVDKSARMQTDLAASPQVRKSAGGQVDTVLHEKAERYTTRLQSSLIKQVKRHAFEHEMNDYDVVQNAIGEYLDKHTS